jgi:hypothetical protein
MAAQGLSAGRHGDYRCKACVVCALCAKPAAQGPVMRCTRYLLKHTAMALFFECLRIINLRSAYQLGSALEPPNAYVASHTLALVTDDLGFCAYAMDSCGSGTHAACVGMNARDAAESYQCDACGGNRGRRRRNVGPEKADEALPESETGIYSRTLFG